MVKFTGPIIIIFFTAVFLFIAATNIQGGWLYLVDAFLWSVFLMALLIPALQLRKLEVKRLHSSSCYVNQPVQIQLKITNRSFFSTSFLSFTDQEPTRFLREQVKATAEASPKGFVVSLSPGESYTYTYTLSFPIRGAFVFSAVRVGSFGPFGLIGVYRNLKQKSTIVVQPTLPESHLTEALENEDQQFIQQAQKIAKNSLNISHFRDYQPGDNKRAIHWKNSAKNARLIVAETREEPTRQVRIIVDTHQAQTLKQLEKAAILAGLLCHVFLEQSYELQCYAQPPKEDFWKGTLLQTPTRALKQAPQWQEISFWLALLEADSALTVAEFLPTLSFSNRAETQSVFLITSQLTPELVQELDLIATRTGIKLLVYTTQAETTHSTSSIQVKKWNS